MSKVLIIVEAAGNTARVQSLHGIRCGQELAKAMGGELHLLVLGKDPSSVAQQLASKGYGAKAVHTLAAAEFEPFTAEAWADGIVHAVKTLGVSSVGGTATSTLRDALPRAAALLDAPLASEVVGIKGKDTFTRPIAAGRALLDVQALAPVTCFTVRGTEFEAPEPGAACQVQTLSAASFNTRGAEVLSLTKTKSSRPELSEARVVVSGGRGMREGANFAVLEQLTDLLGGALGASRAATDAGMVPADLQVGQTGKIVAPELYIAVAISGAIQHLAGMKGSKVIVAINKDGEAPIFQIADYGLVATWEETIPKLTALVKAYKGA